MVRLVLIAILLSAYHPGFGVINLSVKIGYSNSKHGDLIEIQQRAVSESLLSIQTVNNFDPSAHLIASLSYVISKHQFGAYYLTKKTGARSGSKDSTGYYQFDQKVGLESFGIFYQYNFWKNIGLGCRLGGTFTKYSLIEKLELNENTLWNNHDKLEASGYEINPYLIYQVRPLNWLGLQFEAGYNFDLSEKFNYIGTDSDFAPDWRGYRVSAGISIDLTQIFSSKEERN